MQKDIQPYITFKKIKKSWKNTTIECFSTHHYTDCKEGSLVSITWLTVFYQYWIFSPGIFVWENYYISQYIQYLIHSLFSCSSVGMIRFEKYKFEIWCLYFPLVIQITIKIWLCLSTAGDRFFQFSFTSTYFGYSRPEFIIISIFIQYSNKLTDDRFVGDRLRMHRFLFLFRSAYWTSYDQCSK